MRMLQHNVSQGEDHPHMNRRELMLLLGAAAMTPAPALRAQQKPMPVIGWLHSLSADRSAAVIAAFRDGLREAGYIDGQSVAIEYRWAEGQYDRLPSLAADLVARKVDVIVTGGGTPPTVAVKKATSTTPIVFAVVSDPVGDGLVASLARPGGNVTGISSFSLQLTAKRVEVLSDLRPHARTIALLVNPKYLLTPRVISYVQEAASQKGMSVAITNAGDERELDAAFSAIQQSHADAVFVGSDPFFYNRRQEITALALRAGIPAIYELREYVAAGGLVSYGSRLDVIYRQTAGYVGRILAGTKPADLPVQEPTRFELVINLKTATALGLTVPPLLLARADEVIE
jgi:putative ABC transport system substrate-binding protein